VLPTVDPELGALVHAELVARGAEVLTGTTVQAITRAAPGHAGRLDVTATATDGTALTRGADMVLVVTGVRPDTSLAAEAGASLGIKGAVAVDPRHADEPAGRAGRRGLREHRSPAPRQTWLPLGTTAHSRAVVAGERPGRETGRSPAAWARRVAKIFDQAAARAGLRDHEAAAGRVRPGHHRNPGR